MAVSECRLKAELQTVFTQLIKPMSDEIIVKDLDKALAGEGGSIDLGRMVGAKEGVGSLADDAVGRFDGQTAKV